MPNSSNNSINTVSLDILQDIINYIEDNLLDLLTPSIIAKQFYMSVSTLNNLFKIVCSITPMEYVRNRRLSLAGLELSNSNIHIIELAFKYGYETPEAFTKAFTRFHGYPPSFVRRTYPKIKVFSPFQIKIEIHGGWEDNGNNNELNLWTKDNSPEQEQNSFYCYDKATKIKGGVPMEKKRYDYHISLHDMEQKEDWRILLLLTNKLDQEGIRFKVDGKTMIFAHGLEFKLEKICLTFKWNEEQRILDFFGYGGKAKSSYKGFKYFDVMFEGMLIRCMFYGECPGADTNEFLFRNTDVVDVDGQKIHVQSLEFYYENAEPKDEYYRMVEEWINSKK